MKRLLELIIVAGFIISSTGCTSLTGPQNAFAKSSRMFKPDTRDYDDGSDEDGHEWDFVGKEGRAGQEREQDPDPWFKQMFMSEKARSIERNLGID